MTAPTGSICDILPAAAALLGVSGAADRLGLTERYGAVPRVVVILVDGMGLHLLPDMAPHAPVLASALSGRVGHLNALACTFPSTTPTSLISLATGVSPGTHGILGFTLNVPGTDRVLTHITWRDDPPPAQWQPVPTWFERTASAGIAARVVLPAPFAGSGLSDAAYRGARFCGVAKGEDYAGRLLDEVCAAPGVVYGYTAVLDTAAHVHGIDSPQWRAAAAEVDAMLSRVIDGLPADAVLLVTADHGGLDVPSASRIDLADEPLLRDGLRVVAGEPRVRYLHTLDGAAADVVDVWRGVLGDRAEVLLREEAVTRGLFGMVAARHLPRIGDVVVVCAGTTVVFASGWESAQVAKLVGFHGGPTAAETAIPLFSLQG